MTFKGRCVECGELRDCFYHHIAYSPDEVVAVCNPCHQKIHYGDPRETMTHDPTNHGKKWRQRKELKRISNRQLNEYE